MQKRILINLVGIFSLCVIVSLTACSPPITVNYLRDNPAGKFEFDVDKRYQDVFATILAQSRQCYFTGKLLSHQMAIRDSQNIKAKTGNITVSLLYGANSIETHYTVDIIALNEDRSRVVTYYAKANTAPEAEIIKTWVTEDTNICTENLT